MWEIKKKRTDLLDILHDEVSLSGHVLASGRDCHTHKVPNSDVQAAV